MKIIRKMIALFTTVILACSSLSGCGAKAQTNEELPMDPEVMKPWINSNIMGMVTDDTKVSIKDDFYLAANRDWLKDATLRPGYAQEQPLMEAGEIVKQRCKKILSDKSLTGEDAARIRAYYEMWLDWDARNEVGIEPLIPFVEALGKVETIDEMSEFILSDLYHDYGVSFVGTDVGYNAEDSSLYELNLTSTPLSLDNSAEYSTLTENGKRLQTMIKGQNTYMLSRVGYDEKEIAAILKDFDEFEGKIAAYEKTLFERSDASAIQKAINPVTIEDLKEMCPDYPLVAYLERNGVADSKLINVEEPKWLKGLNELYKEENLPGIKAYILTTSLRGFMTFIDEEAYRKYQELNNEFRGIEESSPDEDIAYQVCRRLFPDCFARLYVKEYMNEEIRQEITQFCKDAIDAYDTMLDEEEWLSPETREAAKYKLSRINIRAVYPDKWEDDSMYRVTPKEDGGSYLQAVLDYREAGWEDMRSRINTAVDKDIWNVNILDTNAFYDPVTNSINIIPGFFCDATYSSDMSIEEKYGALGSVIGHEISHAFDTIGSQFDADGNVKNWWTQEDEAAFSERADKLIKYYDEVVAFDNGTVYRGQLIQTEAIADMAGIKCMLMMAKKIDGFDYDKFFRANAHLLARVGTTEYMENQALSNSHPLNYLRVNVTFSQFDEFYKTYGIKKWNGMYIAPKDRISVW
ncbi:M13 family metallopeptidase [Butyrivibrio sp. FCS014]|uniref:M13 family metallopeptidase n=1 Tax=Butyrivibrio sp. FCS014 TaxID=1408304 RepID=UPI0004640E96|nr:M13 family metallopeptidase [Butyrivibrio sp. FCS014]